MHGRATIPTIAVTLSSHTGDPGQAATENRYREAVRQYRVQVVDLRPDQHRADLTAVDGLLLSGGGDIEPWRYGAEDSGRCREVDAARDEMELGLTRAVLSDGLPVLGICRGAQVLGVALGGQLVQDIGSEVAGAQEHTGAGGCPDAGHWMEVAHGSRLAGIIGTGRMWVNSSHHQANWRLGGGVRRAAWCEDGVIEAIEAEGAGFAIGVQWHPERMPESEWSQRLFAAFAEACRAFRRQREG